MILTMLNWYRFLCVNRHFFRFHKLLYRLSLRGLGVMNYESSQVSGELNFIGSHVTTMRESTVFDVGANVGAYSKCLRNSNGNINIYAFEPHPKTYRKLEESVHGLNINTYNVGVGFSSGVMSLYDYADEDGSSHASLYRNVIENIHQRKSTMHEVRIITLDAFALENRIGRVGLLKIDTEGHEFEVLKGFEKYIKSDKVDLIHFEFNEMNVISRVFFKDFWDFLPNYDFFRMLPDGLVPIEKYSPLHCEIFAYQNIVAKLKKSKNMS